MKWSLFLMASTLCNIFSGCAVLHRVHVGNIDNTRPGKRIEVTVSEIGVDLKSSSQTLSALNNSKNRRQQNKSLKQIADIISLFQMGPRTGNPVYNRNYTDQIRRQLISKCPNGKITNLLSQRELNDYGIVSGELVRVTADCLPNNP